MMMNRRAFSTALVAGGTASLISTRGVAANSTLAKASNVVLVHGLFADGSSWSEVIARLQSAGLNATAVQNPLTTLPEAVASAQRVLARQDGPTVLVGHSFSGMIVTEAGMHPNVSALVYVAARAPDAGEDYAALAKTFPTPPASAGIVFDGDEGRLSEEAFLHDFAGDLPEAKAKVLYAVQEPFHKAIICQLTRIGGPRYGDSCVTGRRRIATEGSPEDPIPSDLLVYASPGYLCCGRFGLRLWPLCPP